MLKSYLLVFFVSMVPLIELRGAIPIGLGMGLPILPTYLVCVVGNMIPVPFIYLFARKFLIWGYHKPLIGPICKFCIVKGEKGGRALEAKAGRGLVVALLLFVGIPLPGTGAWTGTLAGSILDMKFKDVVKACMGGGGRGIRLVESPAQMEAAFLSAQKESLSAFGDGAVYLEKFLSPVKHIEMQLLCDNFDGVVCLGERECSMQRKHQKLIEESPSPAVDEALRIKMLAAATRAAKAVNYEGVGTVEFLLTKDKQFYFMEMNTRLQVEHPVTEMVTGLDLVKWQMRCAADTELPFGQDDVHMSGHAIECRINAETRDFLPSSGRISMLHVPNGPWVRFDSCLYQGCTVPPYYDSLLGKLIVHAPTREEAVRKMRSALGELAIEGVSNNSELQLDILNNPEFLSGVYHTDLMGHLYATHTS